MKKSLIALGIVGVLSLSMVTGFAAENTSSSNNDRDVAFERMYQSCRDYYDKYVRDNKDNANVDAGWCYGPRDDAGWCYGPRDNR